MAGLNFARALRAPRSLLLLLVATALAALASTAEAQPAAASAPAAPGLYDRPVLAIDPGLHTASINRAEADAEGRWAATASADKTLRIWSVADGALLRTIRLPAGPGNLGKPYAVAVSPDGALVAAGGWTRVSDADPQKQIYLFERESGALARRIQGLPNNVNHLAFSPDGRRLAAVLAQGHGLRIYARERGWAEVAGDGDYGDSGWGLAFAPDGRQLATAARDGKVRLYAGDLAGEVRPAAAVEGPAGREPFSIAFSPDGRRLAVGYADNTAVSLLDGRTLAPLPGPNLGGVAGGNLSKVAWSRDGRTLFAAGSPALPDVPSAPEAGLPGLVHEEFFPILAPAGTPAPVVAALGAAFRGAIQQNAPKLVELAGVAPRAGFETSEQVMDFVREGVERYTAILRAAGVQPE